MFARPGVPGGAVTRARVCPCGHGSPRRGLGTATAPSSPLAPPKHPQNQPKNRPKPKRGAAPSPLRPAPPPSAPPLPRAAADWSGGAGTCGRRRCAWLAPPPRAGRSGVVMAGGGAGPPRPRSYEEYLQEQVAARDLHYLEVSGREGAARSHPPHGAPRPGQRGGPRWSPRGRARACSPAGTSQGTGQCLAPEGRRARCGLAEALVPLR